MSVFYGNPLQFETGVEEESAAAQEGSRWKGAGEVGAIDDVEALPERDVAAEDLKLYEVIERHPCHAENALQIFHYQVGFFFSGIGHSETAFDEAYTP